MKFLLITLALLLPTLSYADLKEDLLAMSGSLAPALAECQNLEAYRYGEKPAIKQLCPYHNAGGGIERAKKTAIVDGQSWYRLQYWIELL